MTTKRSTSDRKSPLVRLLPLTAAALSLAACGSTSPTPTAVTPTAASPAAVTPNAADGDNGNDATVLLPDIIAVEITERADGTFTVAATVSSPYDSPDRYADAFRVLDEQGTELGVRVLTHDHANEQPFTRSLNSLEIPAGVADVTVEGRDQISGWGGATVTVAVPGR